MANKTLFPEHQERSSASDDRQRGRRPGVQVRAEACAGPDGGDRCFNVFYASAQTQLDEMRKLIDQVDDNVFLAKLAVYARERAYMKDMPAALLVVLSKRDTELMHRVFDRVVDNGRVLRTMFQMIRSGQFGRTSLSSRLQRAFQRWLNEASVGKLLSASIGNDPSLRDVLRMARPTPKDNAAACAVRLADGQGDREVGSGNRGRPAGAGPGADRVPSGGHGRGAGVDPG